MLKVATKFCPEEDRFRTARDAGFRWVEFWLDADWLRQWQTVVDRAAAHEFGYALHFPNQGALTEETLQQSLCLYRELGCSAMVIHEPMRARYGKWLSGREPTLRLGVENHRLSPPDFTRWAEQNRYLTLDVEHLWKFTLADAPLDTLLAALDDFLARFADKLVHVHLPGYTVGSEEHRPMYCSREMVLPVLSRLADCRYEQLIVSEVAPQYQNAAELRMDVLLVQRWRELRQQETTGAAHRTRVA